MQAWSSAILANMDIKDSTLIAHAYHEAGHAIINHLLNGRRVISISIIPNSDSQGRFIRVPAGSNYFQPRSSGDSKVIMRMYIEVAVSLAGDLSEMRVTGKYNYDNVEGDFKKALDMAAAIMFHIDDDRHIVNYIDEVSERVKVLFDDNWPAVEALAQALLEKRELAGEEAKAIIKKHINKA